MTGRAPKRAAAPRTGPSSWAGPATGGAVVAAASEEPKGANLLGQWSNADFARIWKAPKELLKNVHYMYGACNYFHVHGHLDEVLVCYWAKRIFYRGKTSCLNYLARVWRGLAKATHPDVAREADPVVSHELTTVLAGIKDA